MAVTNYNVSSSGYAQQGLGWSTGTGSVIQGSLSSGGWYNYYGVMFFDFAAIRNTNVAYRPKSITVTIPSNVNYSRSVSLYIGSGMAKDTWTSGSRPTALAGPITVSVPANGTATFTTTNSTWLSALVNSSATCLYINAGNDDAKYWEGKGSKAQLSIDWEIRLTEPVNLSVSPSTAYKGQSVTVTIGRPKNYPTNMGNLTYKLYANNTQVGSVSQSYTLGTASIAWTVDIAGTVSGTLVSLKATCEAGGYTSAASEAVSLTVKKISAPSLSVSPTSAYQNQSITLTASRPSQHPTGSITYTFYSGTTSIGTASGSGSTVTLSYTLPGPGKLDKALTFTVTATDVYGNVSGSSSSKSVTDKRFTNPTVSIDSYTRPAGSIELTVRAADTGYSQTGQSRDQLQTSISITVTGGAYGTITQTNWTTSMKKTVTISGTDDNTRYTVSVTITNVAPAGLSDKSGSATQIVNESTPAVMVYHDTSSNTDGLQTKSLIVGDDFTKNPILNAIRVCGTDPFDLRGDGTASSYPLPVGQGGTGYTGTASIAASVSSTVGSISVIECRRWGRVAMVVLDCSNGSAIDAMNYLARGTLSGADVPLPKRLATAVQFTGAHLSVCSLDTDGTITSRVMVGTLPASSARRFTFTYLIW